MVDRIANISLKNVAIFAYAAIVLNALAVTLGIYLGVLSVVQILLMIPLLFLASKAFIERQAAVLLVFGVIITLATLLNLVITFVVSTH